MTKEVVEKDIKEVIERDFYKNQMLKAFANSTSEQLKDLHNYYILKNHTQTAEELVNQTQTFIKEKENEK